MKMGIGIVCVSAGLFIAASGGVRAEDIHRSQASGIEVPPAPALGQLPSAPAKASLEAMLLGQLVELRGPQDVTDRYGRTVAFLVRQDGAIDVAGDLLARGHARVAAQIGDAACAAE